MATGTNGIATEGEAKIKLGYSGSVDTNKCCTKARAVAMGADSSRLTSYKDNQLVKYSDIIKIPGLDPDTAPNGVYICDDKGRLWKRTEWNNYFQKASGVAVKTIFCKFVIAPVERNSTPWSRLNSSKLINGCTVASYSGMAENDYKGKQNTDAIVSQLGTSEMHAARYCKEYTFLHGVQGYLPALGELYQAYQNRTEVEACMSLIGGTAMYNSSSNNYGKWSSTQHSNSYAWYFSWMDGFMIYAGKGSMDNYMYVRPFAAFR